MNLRPPYSMTRRAAWIATAALALTPLAQAQQAAFPSKPITFVVPFAAGSATDTLARALGQSVSEQTGQPVVIDNKAGASGMIAAQMVARAPGDGYTVIISTNTTHAANEHLFKRLAYDPVKDFAPITGLGKGGMVMVVKADSPYKTVADVLAAARQTPNKLSFASGSASSRVAGELFQQMANVNLLHVPYRSNPMGVTDLLGGQVTMMFTDTSTGVPQVASGNLRALGVTTSTRKAALPSTPTIAEAGVPGYEMGYWFAAYAPAATPAPVVKRLNELLHAALKSPGAQQFFTSSSGQPFPTTPEALAKFQADETAKWGRIIKTAGIEPE